MNRLYKIRAFRKRHGYDFPMLPRRPGLCAYPVSIPALFYKFPSRCFFSRYETD